MRNLSARSTKYSPFKWARFFVHLHILCILLWGLTWFSVEEFHETKNQPVEMIEGDHSLGGDRKNPIPLWNRPQLSGNPPLNLTKPWFLVFNMVYCLVVWNMNHEWYIFPETVGKNFIPSDFHIFQRGRSTTNQFFFLGGGDVRDSITPFWLAGTGEKLIGLITSLEIWHLGWKLVLLRWEGFFVSVQS